MEVQEMVEGLMVEFAKLTDNQRSAILWAVISLVGVTEVDEVLRGISDGDYIVAGIDNTPLEEAIEVSSPNDIVDALFKNRETGHDIPEQVLDLLNARFK